MVGRLFAQDPRLYSDIIMSSEDNLRLIEAFVESLRQDLEYVKNRDYEGFTKAFLNVREYFSDFAQVAFKESGSILAKLQDERS